MQPISTTTSPSAENVRFAVRAAAATPGGSMPPLDGWAWPAAWPRPSAAKLSAGQRRRVALAVLVARWPELWLLDEPHAGLDASARQTPGPAGHRGGRRRGHCGHRLARGRTAVESLAARAVTMTGGRVIAERTVGRGPRSGRSQADAGRRVAHVA